jgi:hypothetical protein
MKKNLYRGSSLGVKKRGQKKGRGRKRKPFIGLSVDLLDIGVMLPLQRRH